MLKKIKLVGTRVYDTCYEGFFLNFSQCKLLYVWYKVKIF